MRLNRFDAVLFLVGCATALAVLHLVVTYRDRGSLTAVTAAIGLGKGVMLFRKLVPFQRQMKSQTRPCDGSA